MDKTEEKKSIENYSKWMDISYSKALLRWNYGVESLVKYKYIKRISADIEDIAWSDEFIALINEEKEEKRKAEELAKEEQRLMRAKEAARRWFQEEQKKKKKGLIKK